MKFTMRSSRATPVWRSTAWGALMLLAGCASAPQPPVSTESDFTPTTTSANALAQRQHWSGKLSVRIDDEPVRYFSAGFELRGQPNSGEMQLFSPLGSTVATLRWQPDGAQWLRGDELRHYPSMAELGIDLTGTALPLNSLFDWLHGRPTAVEGWQVDLSQHADGKLQAQRLYPTPSAQLRLVFEP